MSFIFFKSIYLKKILKLNKPGRLDDSVNNTIVNKVKCSDFQWDPFDEQTLAAGLYMFKIIRKAIRIYKII